jgi:glycosyltransferase involved in cell wall biosynthesis
MPETMKNFPRLLVAAEFPPNMPGGGGAIMRQMLKDWPVERLFWWSCLPDRNQCFGQRVATHRVAIIPSRLYPNKRFLSSKTWILKHFWSRWAAHHFRETLALVKPDVVWVIPLSWCLPPLFKELLPSGIPFHVSVPDYADCGGWAKKFRQSQTREFAMQADLLYARATTRDAICQPMVDDLRARTGADGTVMRCGLEPEDFEYLSAKTSVPTDVIRIAYPGTIIVEKEFALFTQALARVRHQLPRPVSLEFFGDHSYRSRQWFDPAWMTEHGNLPAAELLSALKKCSWGFAPMGLTDDNPRYNRFSLPTKFVSYLQAGLPVITLGHPESSVMKMAAAYPVGVSHADADMDSFGQKLRTALSANPPWEQFGPEIRRCARQEFDAQKMRAALHEHFRICAGASPAAA